MSQRIDIAPQPEVPQSMSTELKHLRTRMIAMENLMITMLEHAAERQFKLDCATAAFISARPGFTLQLNTGGAAAQMTHVFDRVRLAQVWVDGGELS